jgi:hypothetical protein
MTPCGFTPSVSRGQRIERVLVVWGRSKRENARPPNYRPDCVRKDPGHLRREIQPVQRTQSPLAADAVAFGVYLEGFVLMENHEKSA